MPLLSPPDYRPPLPFRNGHLHTIYPSVLRKVSGVVYQRERIDTPDNDFLDLDWLREGSTRAAVISHGLEGNTDRSYVRGMARALSGAGWDVLAWNFRGCSGLPNRLRRSYHSGATDDLGVVVNHALEQGYSQIALIGFSLGGNITLKYLGEQGEAVRAHIVGAVTFSVPCDLDAGSAQIDRRTNWLYRKRFLIHLGRKVRAKQVLFPDDIDASGFGRIRTLRHFDDRYTAPLHGFEDAADYYARCSCKSFLEGIRVPTLLVNAADDPFLPAACYPVEEARTHPYVYLEIPHYGGHVGFIGEQGGSVYWSEHRAIAFLESVG